MQGKIIEPRDDIICGLPCKFDDEDKIRRRNLAVSQVSSRNNVGGNSISKSERNTQQERCSEINEASVLLHSLNAFTGLNFDEYPVFTKLMRKAHVEAGFLLGMPATFCRTHLLKEDTMMTLETDEGEQYEAKYLPRHGALSGGWKRFALDKKLQQEDLVVFQLVEPTKFKLYISRKNSSTEELPTAVPNLHTKATESDEDDKPLITYMRKEPCQSELKSNKKTGNEVGIHFSNITGFQDFNNIATELLQNHDVSEFTLNAYYKLCRSQNSFLHADLVKGLNTRKVNGAIRRTISKTVEIASTLRNCTLSSFLGDFSQWNKTLNYCESLGLDVNFLRAHLYQLRDLTVDSDGPIIKACRERPRSECQAKKLEIIIAELRKISDVLAAEVKTLESTAGWEKYFEACSWHIQVEDDIREIEGLLAEFGKFFEH